MKKQTPQSLAGIRWLPGLAVALAALPALLTFNVQPDLVPEHLWPVVILLSFWVSGAAGQWVYQRGLAQQSTSLHIEPPGSPIELNLTREPLPWAVWSSVVPPIIVVWLVWWIVAHSGELPWGGFKPSHAGSPSLLRMVVIQLAFWNSFALWVVGYGLATWYGVSRTYNFRRPLLLGMVVNQWAALVFTVSLNAFLWFDVPPSLAPVCAAGYIGGLVFIIWHNLKMRRLYAERDSQIGAAFYFDWRDAALMGHRGVNLANMWLWLLIAASFVPAAFSYWLLDKATA
jgi:hypothetical protein